VEHSAWDALYEAFAASEGERRAQEALERAQDDARREHDAWAEHAMRHVLDDLQQAALQRAAELATRTRIQLGVELCDDIAAAEGSDLPRVASLRLTLHDRQVALYAYRISGGLPFVHLMHSAPPHVLVGRHRLMSLPGCMLVRRGAQCVLERLEPAQHRFGSPPVTIDELVLRAFELLLAATRTLHSKAGRSLTPLPAH